MKRRISILAGISCLCAVVWIGCKQQFIQGPKVAETGKVYFPPDTTYGAVIPALSRNIIAYDSANNSVDVAVSVYRGGFSDFETFSINVSADTSAIQGLIKSGALPANTVALQPGDYTLNPTDSITYNNYIMQGKITPQIKVSSLAQYIGKTIALGLTITGSSKFSVNDSMNTIVVYMPVDSLTGEVYFSPAISKGNNAVDSVLNSHYVYDSLAGIVTFPILIGKNGIVPATGSITAQITVDNSAISGLVASGALPANTIALPTAGYSLNNTVTLSSQNGVLSGNVLPAINIADMEQYKGTDQNFALGLTITSLSSSQYGINATANKIVLVFNVDDFFLYVLKANVLDYNNWLIANISPGITDIQLTPNATAQSYQWTGGDPGYGQIGIYQAVNVKAGITYMINMNVVSPSGIGNGSSWFELWATDKQPQNGNDITTGWTNGGPGGFAYMLAGINTYNPCGTSGFNTLLSIEQCEFPSGNSAPGATAAGQVTFPQTGTYYIVVKCGGPSLGSGITASNITMIPQVN